jgi:hypothetical protein
MSTVEQILNAVRGLSFEEYLQLRSALDSLDETEWKAELERSTKQWNESGLTDDDIDRAVARRRYENRS